jgi:hypothetical protein
MLTVRCRKEAELLSETGKYHVSVFTSGDEFFFFFDQQVFFKYLELKHLKLGNLPKSEDAR